MPEQIGKLIKAGPELKADGEGTVFKMTVDKKVYTLFRPEHIEQVKGLDLGTRVTVTYHMSADGKYANADSIEPAPEEAKTQPPSTLSKDEWAAKDWRADFRACIAIASGNGALAGDKAIVMAWHYLQAIYQGKPYVEACMNRLREQGEAMPYNSNIGADTAITKPTPKSKANEAKSKEAKAQALGFLSAAGQHDWRQELMRALDSMFTTEGERKQWLQERDALPTDSLTKARIEALIQLAQGKNANT